MAIAAQTKFEIDETVYQSLDNPNSLTIVISGTAEAVAARFNSPERARLATQLELETAVESWETKELLAR